MIRFMMMLFVTVFFCMAMTSCSTKNVVGELMFTRTPIDNQMVLEKKVQTKNLDERAQALHKECQSIEEEYQGYIEMIKDMPLSKTLLEGVSETSEHIDSVLEKENSKHLVKQKDYKQELLEI
ncbi:hypothetical protein KJ671_02140 [Patescibacteria group bacterium]|nr:hypothetical protein [Patescibacteria group bacterium]